MIDALYGEGATETLLRVLREIGGDVEVEQIKLRDGTVRVNVRWEKARTKMVCAPRTIYFLQLDSNEGTPTGLYTKMCAELQVLFRDGWGVTEVRASPATPKAEAILRTRGAWDENMVWRL